MNFIILTLILKFNNMSSQRVISNPFSPFMDNKKRSSSWPKILRAVETVEKNVNDTFYDTYSEANI